MFRALLVALLLATSALADSTRLDEVVVTAERVEQTARDIPASTLRIYEETQDNPRMRS